MSNNTEIPFRADLDRVEKAVDSCRLFPLDRLCIDRGTDLNPSLEVMPVQWSGLCHYLENGQTPRQTPEMILVWKVPATGEVRCLDAGPDDLLALKIVSESISVHQAAVEGGVSVGSIEAVMHKAVEKGLLLRGPSKIVRDESFKDKAMSGDGQSRVAEVFTLQWHITQACDLHCKHCYDRSDRDLLDFTKALAILDDLHDFCNQNGVQGQVTFTGGNPILYPRFRELYQEAAERGFLLAILGNPTNRRIIDEIIEIRRPEFFQVSLEGLEAHNDEIRGTGHFKRVVEFLEMLREKGVFSMVMLTLTMENVREVLPLAEFLRDKVDLFTFNRLTLFGEGAALKALPAGAFDDFLEQYRKAAMNNPIMSLKDNLLNRLHHTQGRELFGGCAGFGCGAAFNFVSLLPDGEVHACRKFPSCIGNAFEQSFQEIYFSQLAQKYRKGSEACINCTIRSVCRGCPAVVAGHGLDPFRDRDPYCAGDLDG